MINFSIIAKPRAKQYVYETFDKYDISYNCRAFPIEELESIKENISQGRIDKMTIELAVSNDYFQLCIDGLSHIVGDIVMMSSYVKIKEITLENADYEVLRKDVQAQLTKEQVHSLKKVHVKDKIRKVIDVFTVNSIDTFVVVNDDPGDIILNEDIPKIFAKDMKELVNYFKKYFPGVTSTNENGVITYQYIHKKGDNTNG